MELLRRLDTVTQHTRLHAHVYTPVSTHIAHTPSTYSRPPRFLNNPVLTATAAHFRTRDVSCGNRVHPRLTSLTPAETQEKFLVQITSLLPKPRPLSGLGIEDGEDLRGSLGLVVSRGAGSCCRLCTHSPALGELRQLRPLPWEPFCPLGRRGRGTRALPPSGCVD